MAGIDEKGHHSIMSNERHCNISDKDHAANIGYIVLALADPHSERGDWDDCPIPRNHRVMTIIDRREPAQHLADALADLSKEDAAGIAEQVKPRDMPTIEATAKANVVAEDVPF
jgi:hypothetical protein